MLGGILYLEVNQVMKYRFGMLAGLLVLGVVGLASLSGVFANRTVEAARPVDYFSHTLLNSNPTGCHLTTDVVWDSKAFAHKAGYYQLYLWGQNETRTGLRRAGSAFGTFDKGTTLASIHQEWGPQNPREDYLARVMFYSSRGKDGADWGRKLMVDDEYYINLSC